MSERTDLAEHATGLGVIGLASMGVNAAPLIPLAVLTAWGIDRFRSCSMRRQRSTIDSIVREIEKSGADHEAIGPALALLKENRHKVAIPPTVLADAEKRGNFPATLYDIVFAGVDVPKDDGVEDLLRLVLTTAWQELRKDEEYHKIFVQEGVAALERDMADGFGRIEGLLAGVKDDTGAIRAAAERSEPKIDNIEAALNSVATANRDLLEALANRFRIADAFDLPDAALRKELEKRAEDYRRVLKEIAELKGVSERIDNIHAAAMEAVRDLRLGEALALLRDARAIVREERLRPVLEDNAKLMVAEAEIDLLDQNPEAAFATLSAAADSFASLDPLEPARKRLGYGTILYEHGLRYADSAMSHAAQMRREALALAPREAAPDLWGKLQNNLGNALSELGQREGETSRLTDAVTAHRAALEVFTREASPRDWAMTQTNLGNVLRMLGSRDGDGTSLSEAVAAYRAALEVFTREASPTDWAMTQTNLGVALRTLGARDGDTARLQEAVAAYRAALEVRTREASPSGWAVTLVNLGNALQTLGARDGDTARLQEAVAAYRAAMEVYTREASPMRWAVIQNNLGITLANLGARGGDTGRLEESITAYRAALEVRTRETSPMDWAMTQNNLGIALANLGACDGNCTRLSEAVAAYRAALDVITREVSPMGWATTQVNLGAALADLGARDGDTARLTEAVAAYRAALDVYTREATPHPYAETMENLAEAHLAFTRLPGRPDPAADLRAGLEAVEDALSVYTSERTPHHHGTATRLRADILAALDKA